MRPDRIGLLIAMFLVRICDCGDFNGKNDRSIRLGELGILRCDFLDPFDCQFVQSQRHLAQVLPGDCYPVRREQQLEHIVFVPLRKFGGSEMRYGENKEVPALQFDAERLRLRVFIPAHHASLGRAGLRGFTLGLARSNHGMDTFRRAELALTRDASAAMRWQIVAASWRPRVRPSVRFFRKPSGFLNWLERR